MEGSPTRKGFVQIVGESGEVISFALGDYSVGEILAIVCSEFGFELSCMALQKYDAKRNGSLHVDSILNNQLILKEGDIVQLVNVKNNQSAREKLHLPLSPGQNDNNNAQRDVLLKELKERKSSTKNKEDGIIILHDGVEYEFTFPNGVKMMNKDQLCAKFCSQHGLDKNEYTIYGSIEPQLCHCGETVLLVKEKVCDNVKEEKKKPPVKWKPILVQVKDEPITYIGIPMLRKSKDDVEPQPSQFLLYEECLQYICTIMNFDPKDYFFKFIDHEFKVPKKISENTRLKLVRRF